jgi:hypothetical protein
LGCSGGAGAVRVETGDGFVGPLGLVAFGDDGRNPINWLVGREGEGGWEVWRAYVQQAALC